MIIIEDIKNIYFMVSTSQVKVIVGCRAKHVLSETECKKKKK